MDQRQSPRDLRNRLFELLKTRSFRRGRVVLASGKESDYYFDTKPTMLHRRPDLLPKFLQKMESEQ